MSGENLKAYIKYKSKFGRELKSLEAEKVALEVQKNMKRGSNFDVGYFDEQLDLINAKINLLSKLFV